MRLRSVFEHQQAVRTCERLNRRDIARLAVKVHRDDRCSAMADQRTCGIWIDQPRACVDVAQNRHSAYVCHRQGRGDERVGGNDDLVARTNAAGSQHQ